LPSVPGGGRNEVWLLVAAAHSTLPFPLLYASASAASILPLMIVLWLLILRGICIELRNHNEVGVWRALLDVVFGLASRCLPSLWAALANCCVAFPSRRRLLLSAFVDDWQPGVHLASRLVHDHRGLLRWWRSRPWRSLAHHQDLGELASAPPHRHPTLALRCGSHRVSSPHQSSPRQPEYYFITPSLRRSRRSRSFHGGIGLFHRKAQPVKAFLSSVLYSSSCWPEPAGALSYAATCTTGATAHHPTAPSLPPHPWLLAGLVELGMALVIRLHCLRVCQVFSRKVISTLSTGQFEKHSLEPLAKSMGLFLLVADGFLFVAHHEKGG